MNRKTIGALVAAAAMFGAVAAHANDVKVGVLLPFSGGEAGSGMQVWRGIELYMAQHPEAFGPNKVTLIKRDTTGPKPDVTKRLMTELVTNDKVDIFAGFVFTPNAMVAAEVANKAKVPVVVMNAATAAITTKSPYVVRTNRTMWHTAYPMGTYAYEKLGVRKAITLYANYGPGVDAKTAFTTSFTKAGGKVVDDVPLPFPQMPDFTPYMQRIKDAKPDAVFIFVPATKWASGVMKSANDVGLAENKIKVIGTGDVMQEGEMVNMDDSVVGTITGGNYSPSHNSPENKAFVAAFKARYGAKSEPDFYTVGGWNGMALIADAIRTLNGKITADGFMKVAKGWKYDSPQGPVMIDPETRDEIQNIYIRKTEKVNGELTNVEIDTLPSVKDPWHELHKK